MNWDDLSDNRFMDLGFKCGLEVHQQLDTAKKLLCRCPVGYVNRPPEGTIIRHMRPTLSELGEYDGTALMEFKTKKEVVYELYRDCVCTYEMDDTPPFPINQEALDIAVSVTSFPHNNASYPRLFLFSARLWQKRLSISFAPSSN